MRMRISAGCKSFVGCGALLLSILLWGQRAAREDSFRFALLGDRTGETQAGVYQQIWKEIASEDPAFAVSVGDTIQGMQDETAEAQWRQIDQVLSPYRRYALYLAPGNHDIWSAKSEQLFRQHAPGLHYGFDYGPAHFTILDNSRTEAFSNEELAFLESDLKAHVAQPLKFVISHRPSWLLNVALQNPNFGLQQLAKRYGVGYVIAGHLHQMLHFELEGVTYISMASSGGHLRSSAAYGDGWLFAHALVEIEGKNIVFEIREVGPPYGQSRMTKLKAWDMRGLIQERRSKSAAAK
jgi:3',5'-cyclic-AMP phosphodiesterase